MVKDSEGQRLADLCAQQHGYFATIYCASINGEGIYLPLYKDNKEHETKGFYVVVRKGITELVQDKNEAYRIYCTLRDRSCDITRRGVSAYKRFIDKYDQDKLTPEDDDYAGELLDMVYMEGGRVYDSQVNLDYFFMFFEIAERYKKRLALFPDEEGELIRHIQIVE